MPTKEIRPVETISLELLIFLLILISPNPERTAPMSGKTELTRQFLKLEAFFYNL